MRRNSMSGSVVKEGYISRNIVSTRNGHRSILTGHLILGIMILIASVVTFCVNWNRMKLTLNCHDRVCEYIESDIFNENKNVKIFNLDNRLRLKTEVIESKTRENGHTRTHYDTIYFVIVEGEPIQINKEFYEIIASQYYNSNSMVSSSKYNNMIGALVLISIVGIGFISTYSILNKYV